MGIREAFSQVYPDVNINEIMELTDSYPDTRHVNRTNDDESWGLGAIGLLSLVTGAIAYFTGYSTRESALEKQRQEHEQKLHEIQQDLEEEKEKINREREEEREEVKRLVEMLGKQSTDVRQLLDTVQQTLAVLQSQGSKSQGAGPLNSSSPITNLLSKNLTDNSKPAWFTSGKIRKKWSSKIDVNMK